MPQPLRVVDPQRDLPRDIARPAVKEFRLDRDDPEKPLPVSNQDHSGAPRLAVDEVIERTERAMQDELRPRYRVDLEFFIKAVLVFLLAAGLVGLVKLVISMM